MKVLTWNINGIRASKVPLKQLFDSLGADVICLQETKVTRDQLDEATAIVEGYNSYFSFSRVRSGYSGVATYCKDNATPVGAEEGLTGLVSGTDSIGCYGDHAPFSDEDLQALDAEGRAVLTEHKVKFRDGEESRLVIVNVYCPRADPDNQDRTSFKLKFYQLAQARCQALLKAAKHVILLGDINCSHKTIDHCDPSDPEYFDARPARQWMNQFLAEVKRLPGSPLTREPLPPPSRPGLLVDTFRFFHPHREGAFTCWSTLTGARATNYGTRIDYILADRRLCLRALDDCEILSEVEGSDHCPVRSRLALTFEPGGRPPPLCARNMPEFAGKQQKLSAFFRKMCGGPPAQGEGSSGGRAEARMAAAAATNSGAAVKRPAPTPNAAISGFAKRTKTGSKQPVGGSRCSANAAKQKRAQGSLTSFFQKKQPQGKDDTKSNDVKGWATTDTEGSTQITDGQCTIGLPLSLEESSQSSVSSESNGDSSQASVAANNLQGSKVNPANVAAAWKGVFSRPPPLPLCKGHGEPCVQRTVKKAGQNFGKKFYVCARPEGHRSNPDARCDHFQWHAPKKTYQKLS